MDQHTESKNRDFFGVISLFQVMDITDVSNYAMNIPNIVYDNQYMKDL